MEDDGGSSRCRASRALGEAKREDVQDVPVVRDRCMGLLQSNGRNVRRRVRIKYTKEVYQMVASTAKVEFVRPPWDGGIHQDISRGGGEMGSPRQGEGTTFRTRVE